MIPVTPVEILGPFSTPLDASAPIILTSPNGETIVGSALQVVCAPAPVPTLVNPGSNLIGDASDALLSMGNAVQVVCAPGPVLTCPALNPACDTFDASLCMGNSPCTTPRPSVHERCFETPQFFANTSPCNPMLPPDCFDGRTCGHQDPSIVCMNLQFAAPQFRCVPGPALSQCVPPVSMPCAMVLPTSCSDMQNEHRANVAAPQGEEALQPPTAIQNRNTIYPAEAENSLKAFDFAEHVSAPSFPCAAFDVVASLGHPLQIVKDSVVADQVMAAIQDDSCCKTVISWLLPFVVDLSLSRTGTRVIQEALDHAGTEQRSALIEGFRGNVRRLMDDFNGNYVIQKSLEVMSGSSKPIKFILDELAPSIQEWSRLVKHKFGCRVAQRVVEHCKDETRQPIVDVIEAEAAECVTHGYANYVMQSILQHGTADQKYQIVCALVYLGIPNMTQNQVPATVVETAFEHGDERCRYAIGQAILEWSGAIVNMGCDRWGSIVVKRLLGVVESQRKLPEPLYTEAMHQLMMGITVLRRSKKHGRKFAQFASDFFDLRSEGTQAAAGGA